MFDDNIYKKYLDGGPVRRGSLKALMHVTICTVSNIINEVDHSEDADTKKIAALRKIVKDFWLSKPTS